MTLKTHVMTYKSANHWIEDLFIATDNENGYSLELYNKIQIDHIGNMDLIDYETSFLTTTLNKNTIQSTKEKLALFIWQDLKEKGHWITFEEKKSSATLLEYLIYHLKSNFSDKIHSRLSRSTSDGIFEYIANYSTKKSVKKILSQGYKDQIRTKNNYSLKADFIICRSFDDPNIIVSMLSCKIKTSLFKEVSIQNAILFLRWMQKHYKATDIVNSINRNAVYSGYFYTPKWINIMRMAQTISQEVPHSFSHYFEKVSINILHDELMRIYNLANHNFKNYHYKYSKIEKEFQGVHKNLTFNLVKDTKELHIWGDELNNCLFSFHETIISKDSLIIGVYKDAKLIYAIEYTDNVILQAYGKFNSVIPDDDMQIIHSWFNLDI